MGRSLRHLRALYSRLAFDLDKIKKGKYKTFFQLKNGFYNDTVIIDGINKNNHKEFISDRQYLKGHPWNGTFSAIIDNKLYLPYLLHSYSENLPKTYFFKDKAGYLPIFSGKEISEYRDKVRISSKDLLPFLKRNVNTVFKHTHSSVGEGFYLLSFINNQWLLNNEIKTEEQVLKFLESLNNYILQEKIIQADYSNKINDSSVNTIRFQCAWNKEKKSFEVIRSFHRFGANGQLVDNLGKGNGVLAYIDPKTGILLKEGVINKNGQKVIVKEQDIFHSDSNIKLSGMEIERYRTVAEKIIEISNSISFLRWIGWDVVITNDGFKIIEANSRTTLDTIQQSTGFFSEPWLEDFFNKRT